MVKVDFQLIFSALKGELGICIQNQNINFSNDSAKVVYEIGIENPVIDNLIKF